MPEITLVAEPGRRTGSPESRRLRAAGRIPAVVYGHGVDATAVSVDARELRHALSGESGLNQLLSLHVGTATHLALARSLQRDPVRHTVVHVDFQIVRRDEVISAEVPIVVAGQARRVEQARGLIEQPLTSLTVRATPGAIPTGIEVDVTELAIGDTVRVGDLTLPPGVTTDVDPDEPVVVAAAGVVAVEAERAEAAGAEAAEAEGAPGAGAEAGAEAPAEPAEEG